jgi:hypothetical protein
MGALLASLPRSCELALVQNEVADLFRDDLAALTDEADGGGGGKKESLVSEAQSFTHLTYSKNKVRTASLRRPPPTLTPHTRLPLALAVPPGLVAPSKCLAPSSLTHFPGRGRTPLTPCIISVARC